jgi:cyclic pyranopterin phosphate synthase
MPYQDSFSRPINYLRISVTDRCNLRCVYCMPPKGIELRSHHEILTFEEIARVVEAAAAIGIDRIRLTGGEPLARLGLPDLVRMIAAVPGIDDISMTTNGTLLARHADALAAARLHRVNVSLDTLRPERFRHITRRGRLTDVWDGIEAAQRAGLTPIKLNAVVIRGMNEDEVTDFAQKTLTSSWHVRFIEIMPLGDNAAWAGDGYVSMTEVRARIEAAFGTLEPVGGPAGNGPARYYRVPGAAGTLGFITPVSEHFCFSCNRLRLTADGKLRPCLLSDAESDLRAPLRAGAGQEELADLLLSGIRSKPSGHHLAQGEVPSKRVMAEIGG